MSNQQQQADCECQTDLGGLLEPRFFKALCDPNRIALLARLARCCEPCSVTQLCTCCAVDVSVVSRHLAILRDAGILQAAKRGKEVYYTVRFGELARTLRDIADAIDACCPEPEAGTRTQETGT